jgi:hypothetical protein
MGGGACCRAIGRGRPMLQSAPLCCLKTMAMSAAQACIKGLSWTT